MNVLEDLSKTIRNEITVLEEGGTRVTYLQNSYEYLKIVKLTSVKLEREFSESGKIVTKLRSSLEDDRNLVTILPLGIGCHLVLDALI